MQNNDYLVSLEQVHQQLENQSANYHDAIVTVDDNTGFDGLEFFNYRGEFFELRPMAQKQICAKLQVPYDYMRKCDVDLQSNNLNHWLKKIYGKKLFLRMDDNEVRAIFTTRYQPIDNLDITKHMLETISPETKVDFILHDNVMSLSVPSPESNFAMAPKDHLQCGFSILNSETGFRSFSVESYIYRLICTNGLIAPQSTAFAKIRHIVKNFFNKFILSDIIEQIKESSYRVLGDLEYTRQVSYEDVTPVMNAINKRLTVTEQEATAAIWGLTQEPGNTLYHLVNAYTRGAQYPDLPTDSQYHMQVVGGMITGLAHKRDRVIDVTSYVVND